MPARPNHAHSRKRRTRERARGARVLSGGAPAAERSERMPARKAARPSRESAVSRTYGERPKPRWHPVPVSELLIACGAVSMVIGLQGGAPYGGKPALIGLLAVAAGTLEVTWREHGSGYRSHSIMLAALPVITFHSVVILLLSLFLRVPVVVNTGLLAVDIGLFALLLSVARSRFQARRLQRIGRG